MNAYLLSLNPQASIADQWDFGFLDDFLRGRLWKTADWEDFTIYPNVDDLPRDANRSIVVLPARHHAGLENKVNKQLYRLNGGVLFLMGDEEADFNVSKIDAPFHIWVQNPHPGKHDVYNKLGCGYPPQARKHLAGREFHKDVNVFFSGQVTHPRRVEMYEYLNAYGAVDTATIVHATNGFTQGLTPEVYYDHMARAKVVPCPSGAVIPDSFRLFEALEAMALPLADDTNSQGTVMNYWNWLFDEETPFTKYTDTEGLPNIAREELAAYPERLHKLTAWWIKYKRDFAYKVMEQLHE